jgi:hypothetical protein
VLLLERLEAADAAAEDHAEAVLVELAELGEAGVAHGLHGARDRVLRVRIGALRLLPVHRAHGVEPLELAGEPDGELRGVELRDRGRPGAPLEHGAPGRRHVVADGRDRAHTGDDDPSLHQADTFCCR